MEKKDLLKVLGIILGIVGIFSFFQNSIYLSKHSRPYAPPGWDLVQVNDIDSITLSSLLSLGVRSLTLDKNIEIYDKQVINNLFKEMQGRKRARDYTGHWFNKVKFKITYHLSSGQRLSFRITFHASEDIAEYYRMSNPNSYYDVSGGADKGSPELYEILNEAINKSGAKWITANSDCWNTDGPLTYVGCSD